MVEETLDVQGCVLVSLLNCSPTKVKEPLHCEIVKFFSLVNMYKELASDIEGFKISDHGYLIGWAKQGICK